MNKVLLAIIFIAFTSCSSGQDPHIQLIGKWQCVLLMDSGKPAPDEVISSVNWEITEKEITVSIQDRQQTYSYTLNAEQTPWIMDMKKSGKDKTILSIIKIEDGHLFQCASEGALSDQRPTKFESIKGSVNDVLFKLKKIK